MVRIGTFLLLLVLTRLTGLVGAAWAQAPVQGLQPIPALSAHALDTAGLIDAPSRQRLEATLAALETEKGAQVVFLTLATTAPEDIAAYANRVGNAWKIGRRDVGDGVLVIVARDDRAVRIEVAKTLEGAIPDLAAKMIIDEAITPAFRRGDYAAGLQAGAERIAALVRGEALPAPTGRHISMVEGISLMDFALFLFVAVPVAAGVLRGVFGRRLGSLITGAGAGGIALLVTSSVLIALAAAVLGGLLSLLGLSPLGQHMGRRGGRGWGGSSTGGWGGGGWRSGGGGDFGGGGASGRW